MPTYEYECSKCNFIFELFHSIMDDSEKLCEKCGTPAQKLISGGYIIVKGTNTPCSGSSKEIKREINNPYKNNKDIPWYRSSKDGKPKTNIKNPQKYIETGKDE